jgi:hypothetical protein
MGGAVSLFDVTDNFAAKAIKFLRERDISDPRDLYHSLKSTEYGYDKLRSLMEGDFVIDRAEDFFFKCFEEFTHKAPQWSREHSSEYSEVFHLFFEGLNTEEQTRIMIIRQQSDNGACYNHAVIVFEHYVTALLTKGMVVSTYNITKYEARNLRGYDLKWFLSSNQGETTALMTLESLWVFKYHTDVTNIYLPNPHSGGFMRQCYTTLCESILERVKTQPLLVANMKIADILESTDKVIFSEAPPSFPESPRHAMVLIGARRTRDGDYFFLLQNWWKTRFFIEVSGEYLRCCDANIYHLVDDHTVERRKEYEDILYEAPFAATYAGVGERSF